MQRAVGTVLVVVLVVSAGCSAVFDGGGGGEPTSTVTPMAVPTDEPTPTPVPQLAPGLTSQGIENASALVAAHTAALRNRSFTVTSNTTGLDPNGSVVVRRTGTYRIGAAGEGLYFVFERNGSSGSNPGTFPARFVLWSANGSRTLSKLTHVNGTTTYERSATGFGGSRRYIARTGLHHLSSFGTINSSFDTANTTVTGQLTRNGTTLYRVRGTVRNIQRGNVSTLLFVDSRGIIHESRVRQETPSTENLSRTVTETRFSAIGSTEVPDRPSWVDEAINRTTPTSGRTTVTPTATAAANRTETTSNGTASVSATTSSR